MMASFSRVQRRGTGFLSFFERATRRYYMQDYIMIWMEWGYCISGVSRAGLLLELDKTEDLFFKRPQPRNTTQTKIILPDPTIHSYYMVYASETPLSVH